MVKTDQQSLRYIMQQREIGSDYQKWVSKLLGFSFDIQYKPSCANRVADALSRKVGGPVEFCSLLTVTSFDWAKLDQEIQKDTLFAANQARFNDWFEVAPGVQFTRR